MRLSKLETKRLSRVSESARAIICDLNMKGDRLYAKGNDDARAKANELYIESDRIYTEQVLNRKFHQWEADNMKLSKDNFSKCSCRFRTIGTIDAEGTIYTYESKDNRYDVAITSGVKSYQLNMNGFDTDIDNIHHIHREIEKHYNV